MTTTKRPPTLTVFDAASKPDPVAPPASLGASGIALWRNIHNDFEVTDAAGLEMLFQICSAADLVSEYATTITRDGGPTIRTKTGIREHPLVRHQLAAKSFVVRSLHRLGLDIIPPRNEIGRPSGGGAYRGENR